MTRRSILNVTSRKKVDSMMPVVIDEANVHTNGPFTSVSPLL